MSCTFPAAARCAGLSLQLATEPRPEGTKRAGLLSQGPPIGSARVGCLQPGPRGTYATTMCSAALQGTARWIRAGRAAAQQRGGAVVVGPPGVGIRVAAGGQAPLQRAPDPGGAGPYARPRQQVPPLRAAFQQLLACGGARAGMSPNIGCLNTEHVAILPQHGSAAHSRNSTLGHGTVLAQPAGDSLGRHRCFGGGRRHCCPVLATRLRQHGQLGSVPSGISAAGCAAHACHACTWPTSSTTVFRVPETSSFCSEIT